mmetsp:Transcript_26705/g.30832  ORF Transcript_26705/g.30832 Transcript_26705/m.30832 type:complete len:125 (+) Transcript_26705:154-528(+)
MISDKSYGPGRYFLGVGHSFIKYPTTVQNYDFSKSAKADGKYINSRTKDGLRVDLEVSFQYLYIIDRVYDLYKLYGLNYRTPCQKIAVDILTDVATQFNSYQFFQKDAIIREMHTQLNSTFVGH